MVSYVIECADRRGPECAALLLRPVARERGAASVGEHIPNQGDVAPAPDIGEGAHELRRLRFSMRWIKVNQ